MSSNKTSLLFDTAWLWLRLWKVLRELVSFSQLVYNALKRLEYSQGCRERSQRHPLHCSVTLVRTRAKSIEQAVWCYKCQFSDTCHSDKKALAWEGEPKERTLSTASKHRSPRGFNNTLAGSVTPSKTNQSSVKLIPKKFESREVLSCSKFDYLTHASTDLSPARAGDS